MRLGRKPSPTAWAWIDSVIWAESQWPSKHRPRMGSRRSEPPRPARSRGVGLDVGDPGGPGIGPLGRPVDGSGFRRPASEAVAGPPDWDRVRLLDRPGRQGAPGVEEQGLQPLVPDRPDDVPRRGDLPDRPPAVPVHVSALGRGDARRSAARRANCRWSSASSSSTRRPGSRASVLASTWRRGGACRRNPLLYVVPSLMVIPFINDTYLLGQPNLLLLALMLGRVRLLEGRPGRVGGGADRPGGGDQGVPGPGVRVSRLSEALEGDGRDDRRPRRLAPRPADALPRAAEGGGRPGGLDQGDGPEVRLAGRSRSGRSGRTATRTASMIALANRLLRAVPGRRRDEGRLAGERRLARLPRRQRRDPRERRWVSASSSWRRCPDRPGGSSRSDAIEQAMLLLLILMFSPLSFNYFFLWLIYP